MPVKPKKQRKAEQYSRGKAGNFYTSRPWRKLSDLKRKIQPLCEHCLKEGILTDATGRNGVADHIIPLLQDPNKALDINNLQTLCNYHHAVKTGKESRK